LKKKKTTEENNFYKLKIGKKLKEKNYFHEIAPKRPAQKWTSNKMGNAKKGHNKMGCAKVVAQ